MILKKVCFKIYMFKMSAIITYYYQRYIKFGTDRLWNNTQFMFTEQLLVILKYIAYIFAQSKI